MSVPESEVAVPSRMSFDECARYREAACLAERLYPDAIGEALAKMLRDVAEFGYRLGMGSMADRVAAALDNEQLKRKQQDAAKWAAGRWAART
jgi:hypothetical protein